MKNAPIRQHHVPKVYLKNFCNKNDAIFVLNKKTKTVFSAGLTAVALEKDFYTLKRQKDPYCWERFYAKNIEPIMGEIFPKILSQANRFTKEGAVIIAGKEKYRLSVIMIMQLLRGKQSREYQWRTFQNLMPEMMDEKFCSLSENEQEIVTSLLNDETFFKEASMSIALDHLRILSFGQALNQRKFYFLRATGNFEFITSDNPVMFYSTLTGDAQPFTNGLLQVGTVVYFPISPKILLCAVPKGSFLWTTEKADGSLIDIHADQDKKFITKINRKQIEQCHSQAYACSERMLISAQNA